MSNLPPDLLGRLTDRVVDTQVAMLDARGKIQRRHRLSFLTALSDWAAEIIGRASSQSAGSVVVVYEDMQAQLAELRAEVVALRKRLEAIEAVERPREREAGK